MSSKPRTQKQTLGPDPALFAVLKKREHLFRWAEHLTRFANAKPWALERYPHAFLFLGSGDVGEIRDVPQEWDRLEELARSYFEQGAPGGPIRIGAIVRVQEPPTLAKVERFEGERVIIRSLSNPSKVYRAERVDCHTVHPVAVLKLPERVKLARKTQKRLRWILRGLLALNPSRKGGPNAMPRSPADAWAWEACRLVIAVQQNIGWGGNRAPHSRNRRSWRGITEGGTPGDPTSGHRSSNPALAPFAYRVPQSYPCRCQSCRHFFFARRKTARFCPDCRE